jgi:hypothetical protein
MIVRRSIFFLSLFLVIIIIFPVNTLVWLMQSQKTMGVFVFQGEGNALEQFRETFVEIYFKHGKDTVVIKEPGRLRMKIGDLVPVRYLPHHPAGAKVAMFRTLWGSSVVYGGIFFCILLVIFLHPEIVPRRARLKLTYKRPFIQIV